MTILPEAWQNAQASIAAALKKPYLSVYEVQAGQVFAAELDEAIRRYLVGSHFHEAVDPAFRHLNPITTADDARAFIGPLRVLLNKHFASYSAHWRPKQRIVESNSDPILLANTIKASFTAHKAEQDVHFLDDASTVGAADASDDAGLVLVAEALRVSVHDHINNFGKIVFVKNTFPAQNQAMTPDQLRDFKRRFAANLKILESAERVARAAAITLGYSYSGAGLPHEITPWAKLEPTYQNMAKIEDRLTNIWEAGTYTNNRYVRDVLLKLSAQLGPNLDTSGLRSPPPPGQEATTITVKGTILVAAEDALSAALLTANQFSAACAVQ